MFERKTFQHHYEGAVEPFKIIGNVYFTGCIPASSHLIDTKEGLVLIDTGYSDTLFLLIDSIYKLGFRPADIKHIIHTHWHGDHCEATAALAHITGAKTYIGRKDAKAAEQHFHADILLEDGDEIVLGDTIIRVMETPGHTKGTISLFFDTVEKDRTYRVGMFGGAGANKLTPGAYEYDDCVKDYLCSLERLKKEKVEVFIGNHVWNNDTCKKGEILRAGGPNPFIDSELWGEFLEFCRIRALKVNGMPIA